MGQEKAITQESEIKNLSTTETYGHTETQQPHM